MEVSGEKILGIEIYKLKKGFVIKNVDEDEGYVGDSLDELGTVIRSVIEEKDKRRTLKEDILATKPTWHQQQDSSLSEKKTKTTDLSSFK